MGALEQVTQLRSQGKSDQEITNDLQQQGVSPKEINDALNQAQIKNAVAGDIEEMPPQAAGQNPPGQETYTPRAQEMPQGTEEPYDPQTTQPAQEYYSQDAYEGYAPAVTSTDTMMEVAEQVFSEKIKKLQKKVEDFNEFKTLAQTKIENNSERLKRIEKMIDQLQITLLEKISSYGKGFEQTKKEVEMMQDSFGKMVNKIADTTVKKHAPHKIDSKKKSSGKK